jgi:hypothetical protein
MLLRPLKILFSYTFKKGQKRANGKIIIFLAKKILKGQNKTNLAFFKAKRQPCSSKCVNKFGISNFRSKMIDGLRERESGRKLLDMIFAAK